MLEDTDEQPPDDVDKQDQDTGNRIALDEFARTIHGTIEVGLGHDLLATPPGLLMIYDSGAQVGIDGHLLARHRIQGKASTNLRNTASTLGHNDEVDNDQDCKYHHTDREIAADHELAEGLDDMARRVRTGMSLKQDDPGRGNIQRQTQESNQQDDRRKCREIERFLRVDTGHDNDDGQGDIERKGNIERKGREGHDEHREDRQQKRRNAQWYP